MAVDTAAIRERPGRFDVAGLATSRLDALPPASRQLVEAMACLVHTVITLELAQRAMGEGDAQAEALVGGADPAGHGLLGIGDRAIALGGRFTVHSPTRRGDGAHGDAPDLRGPGRGSVDHAGG